MSNIGRNSDAVARHCSRCGLPLTDAASREHGIGPLCRKKNNDIFAKQIPVDITVSSAIMLSLTKVAFHADIADKFDAIKQSFLGKLQHIASNNTEHGMIVLGADFRKIVDWFDVALSYPIQHNTKMHVIKLIDSMGYKRLAGVLRGDVCMSPAKVTLQDGMLVLEAKRNKMGYFAMRKEVPGILLPRFNKAAYKAPTRSAKQFLDVVERYWPFNDSEGILDVLNNIVEDVPTAPITVEVNEVTPIQDLIVEEIPTDNRPVAELSYNTGMGFTVKTPWCGTNKEMFNMLNRFKAIISNERKYNPADCSWSFKNNHLIQIKELVSVRYRLLENING